MSKKKLAGIVAVCITAIIAVIVVTNPRQPTPTTQNYTLTTYISPSGAGSVSPAGGQYESGVQITLSATPASGYTFDYWEDLASSSSNTVSSDTVTITMNANKAITAHFKVVDHAEQGTLTVHFIDVGQGDSILLDLGETEVLIDGGEKSPGVVSYIDDYVDGPLEVMVATHPHTDHIGGLIAVLDAFEVDEIWLNGDTTTSQTYSQFMSAVNSEGAEVFTARRGDTIQAGNLTFNVLNPANLSGTINNNSIVLSLSYGQVDFLFTGDAEQEAEASMLAEGIVPYVEILKVGHHGSRTASSIQFLQAAEPERAIYMAGQSNSYGHPHEETIANLCEVDAEIYGTDIHGTITVTTNGVTYDVLPANNVPPVVCPTVATFDLTIGINGQGTTSPSAGTYEYGSGSQVTITASPASGWEFDHWSGDVSGTSSTIVITMDSDKDVTAYFEGEPGVGSNVQITYIFYDGVVYRTESDEYVEITNLGGMSQNLKGWVLKDISEGYPSFTFPSYVLAPGAKIRVYTNEIHSEWGGFSFGYGKAIWNNTDPDWAALYNAQGQEVSRKSY
jgi:beta-lactamase superfamily II metal-dependent hydrolase